MAIVNLNGGTVAGSSITDIYTVPATIDDPSYPAYANIASVIVCNRGDLCTFRISIATGGAADAAGQYLAYDCPLKKGETKAFEIGIVMNPSDVLRASSSTGLVDFHVMGTVTK